ncbi:hypothetical protein AMJ57_01605 [Parcubacteria bacterium SG8_24]|nr:MAG: hypothetical protein AMJ57_01605 [Parcubacteria bacterium SG8_24]
MAEEENKLKEAIGRFAEIRQDYLKRCRVLFERRDRTLAEIIGLIEDRVSDRPSETRESD